MKKQTRLLCLSLVGVGFFALTKNAENTPISSAPLVKTCQNDPSDHEGHSDKVIKASDDDEE